MRTTSIETTLPRAKGRGHRRRGIALMMVMMAVIVSAVIAYAYVGRQSTSIAIARNINAHARARAVAESGLELAIAYIRSSPDWRTEQSEGIWVENAAIGQGTCTVVGEDGFDTDGDGTIGDSEGDSDLADDSADPLTLTVTGRVGTATHRVRAVISTVPGVSNHLYWADKDTKKIYRATTGGSAVEELIGDVDDPNGLAVDLSGGKIYWADKDTKRIHRANLDGSGSENLVSNVDDPRGLAVDPGGGKIYWLDKNTKKVYRAGLDGSGKEHIVSNVQDPIGVAVDPGGAKVYWADRTTKKIHRANLDGSASEHVVNNVHDPVDVAVDPGGGKLYWSDKNTKKIHRANLDGSGKEDLVNSVDDPAGLAVDPDGGRIYWADKDTRKIHRANLDGSGPADLINNVNDPRGVTIGRRANGGGGGTLYDFGTRSPGSNIFAFDGQSSTKVPSTATSPSSTLTGSEHADIDAVDGDEHAIETSSNNNYAQARFIFEIEEDEEDVTGLEITWVGRNVNQNPGKTDGVEIHIWNCGTSSYELLAQVSGTESTSTLTGILTGDLSAYIDEGSDNAITLLAVSKDRKSGNPFGNTLYADYVSLGVSTSAASGGNSGDTPGYKVDWITVR